MHCQLLLTAALQVIATCPLGIAKPDAVTLFVTNARLPPRFQSDATATVTAAPPTVLARRQSHLSYSRYDNLVAGIAEISLGTSFGVLWSEYAVLTTGCGPLHLSDGLERFCYQALIVAAGFVLFTRIVTQKDLVSLSQDVYGELQEFTLIQVRAAEWLSLLAVLGAFVALASQMYNGEQMDGLSGIDVQMCRAIRDL